MEKLHLIELKTIEVEREIDYINDMRRLGLTNGLLDKVNKVDNMVMELKMLMKSVAL